MQGTVLSLQSIHKKYSAKTQNLDSHERIIQIIQNSIFKFLYIIMNEHFTNNTS